MSQIDFSEQLPPTDSWSKMFNSYGAMVVTVIIFALYATHSTDDTLKNLAVLAAGYWLGSSNSSQKKDDTNAATTAVAMQALATSSPAPLEGSK